MFNVPNRVSDALSYGLIYMLYEVRLTDASILEKFKATEPSDLGIERSRILSILKAPSR